MGGFGDDKEIPFETRTIKEYEIVDGCSAPGDNVHFRFPLRGLCLLTPTLKNVFNKFSVRYYVRCIVYLVEEEEKAKPEGNEDANTSRVMT
mgnify:CR=1 FL=1